MTAPSFSETRLIRPQYSERRRAAERAGLGQRGRSGGHAGADRRTLSCSKQPRGWCCRRASSARCRARAGTRRTSARARSSTRWSPSRFREQYVDALSVYLREQELAGLDVVTDGDCRFDHDVGGQSWTRYPTQHMSGFEHFQPAAGEGRRRRPRVPARPHPARLPRGSGHAEYRRADRTRRAAVRGDLEGGAAADDEAGQVRHGHARARRLRRAGLVLRGRAVADHGDQRRAQRGAPRPRRRRLPRHPDGGAADPPRSPRGASWTT